MKKSFISSGPGHGTKNMLGDSIHGDTRWLNIPLQYKILNK